jgi:hypothetical protein
MDKKKLTDELIAELSGKTTAERRTALRGLFEAGFNIRPYVRDLLEGKAGINGTIESRGFDVRSFGKDTIWEYDLGNGQSIFYKELGRGHYFDWPTPHG